MSDHPSLGQLTNLIMELAAQKGFGTKPEEVNLAEKMVLVHSEVSEAFEAYRHNNMDPDSKDGFQQELADIVTRVLHICGIYGIDLEAAMLAKLKINHERNWDWKKLNEKHS